jgi:hypothetical protein
VYDNSLGFIAGWGVHPLDIALWGIGPDAKAPACYEGTGEIPQKGLYNTISDWDVKCRFKGGVELRFMNARTARARVEQYRPWHDHGTTFFGTEGWVSVDRRGIHARDPDLLKAEIPEGGIRLHESGNHQQNFVDCIKSRTLTISPFESAFQSYVISHLSDLSIRLGRKINWDPDTETVVDGEEASSRLGRAMRAPWKL